MSMKKYILSILILLFFKSFIQAQDYQVIEELFSKAKTEKIYLNSTFKKILPDKSYQVYFKKENFKEIWGPQLPIQKEWPSMELFLKNVNLDHFVAIALNEFDTAVDMKIDFTQLSETFEKVNGGKQHLQKNDAAISLVSKPFLSCDGNWAIISKKTVWFGGGASSDDLYIYRKVHSNWVLYHKLHLNIT